MFGTTSRKELVEVNLGTRDADLVVRNATHVNVHTAELVEEDVAVLGDRIAVVGDVEHAVGEDTTVVDADGKYLTPGLVEGHLHSYHSYLNGTEFAKLLLQHGTTAVADGFYGQGIVAGVEGVEFAKEEIAATPVSMIFLVPALAHLQVTTAGIPWTETGLTMDDMHDMLAWEDCYGLEEPTYEPIVDLDEDYIDLFEETLRAKKVVTGHAALPTDRELSAYAAAGCSTDHEPTTKEGAHQRARWGMTVLSRHGTGLPNLLETVRPVTEEGVDARRFGTSGDVRLPGDLRDVGCIDENVRAAIAEGVDPVVAVQMATINTAEGLRVDQELGSVAPGKVAHLVLVDDLEAFEVDTVVAKGEVVVESGELVADVSQPDYPDWMRDTVDIGGSVAPETFVVEADGDEATVHTIFIPEDAALVSELGEATLDVVDGAVQPDPGRDVVKAAMLDRLEASGRTGVGFVEGFGLGRGALAMSYNAVRENVIVIGTNDDDMSVAVNRIAELNGGVVAARDGEVVSEVALPLFGLQSDQPADDAIESFAAMDAAIAEELDCDRPYPLFGLEFLLCPYPETPGIRICDYGLFDVGERAQLELFV